MTMRTVGLGTVYLIAVIALGGCSDQGPAAIGDDPLSLDPRLAAASSVDTVPCPRNRYRFTRCATLSEEQDDILRREYQVNFAPTGACQQAAQGAMQTLNDGTTFVGLHSQPPAVIGWRDAPLPPYDPRFLLIAEYNFESWRVQGGHLRDVLYHETAHLANAPDPNTPADDGSKLNADEFADMCHRAETQDISSWDGMGGGGGHDEAKKLPSTCLVRVWYYTDNLEVISVEVLACF